MALKHYFEMQDYRRRIETIMSMKVPRKINNKHMPWRMVGKRKAETFYQFAFRVPIGYSASDLEKQLDVLFATCGAMVEIKNRAGVVVVTVLIQDLPEMIEFVETMLELTKGRAVLLGYDIEGKPIIHSFKIPHMLIAGQSGYGKTDLIRWILLQIIAHIPPEHVEIDVIDMKKFSFIPFKGIPHIRRIATDLQGAVEILDDAYNTMNERADLVWNTGNRALVDSFKWRIVLVDEASQISPDVVVGKEAKALASVAAGRAGSISCVGREASVGLIYATQYPTAKVINGQIKANMEAVVCFKTENDVHSNVALDTSGAESITAQGRAFYKSRGGLQLMQAPFVGDDTVWERVLAPYKEVQHDQGRTDQDVPVETSNTGADDFNDPGGDILF